MLNRRIAANGLRQSFPMDEYELSMQLQMAQQYLQYGRLDQAETILQRLLDSEPDNSKALEAIANVFARRKRFGDAVAAAEKAFAREPGNVEISKFLVRALQLHGAQLAESGELDDARACLRRALQIDPDHADIMYMLSHLSIHEEHGDTVHEMERLFAEPELPGDQRRRLAFALGKAYDDLGNYDKAYDFMVEGNRIARGEIEYSTEQRDRDFALLKHHFDAEYFRRCEGVGIDDDRPILVTGLPRSGTTLVEQILSSHPLVHGGGELRVIDEIISRVTERCGTSPLISGFDQAHPGVLSEMASEYSGALAALCPDKPYTTDKNLAMFIYIGLIAVMLPNAKIVHCLRDPRDQGLSVFMNDFGSDQPYAYDLAELAHYTVLYADLMRYWKAVLPGRIHTIGYEELVADPESNIRELLEYCGLDFTEECLNFHRSKREVSTLSLSQVRRPLHSRSIGRWKNYETHLRPLIDALGDEYA